MRVEKETKGAVRYEEVGKTVEEMAIRTLYIRKSVLREEVPKEITVTIE